MTTDDIQQTANNEGVGQQLKQAREKHGLSISQIADAQHLRNGIIQAIENGDYSQIGSELFLKGYVRAYAKQVGLDGNVIIADLDRELEPGRIQKARELEANPLVDIERRRRRKRRVAKLFLLVSAAVIVGAFVVMFVMPKFGFFGAGAEGPVPTETSKQVNEASASNVEVDAPAVSSSEPVADTTAAPSAQESRLESQAEQVTEPEVEDQIPIVSQTTEPALAQPPVSDEPGSATGQLEIVFTGNCWVQVRDASGNRLASSMKRAGERLAVSGEAPLKVVIGAVDTVKSIRFQGEAVDIDKFPVVNNRAEFTLAI
ncbi:MAG: RodZ domain-containing protein [Marinobacter sp.]|uniref:RodZ domain-containing protein n=1 Tax=Marinobacter sp. TaxID=50741 RepID=UPI003F973203